MHSRTGTIMQYMLKQKQCTGKRLGGNLGMLILLSIGIHEMVCATGVTSKAGNCGLKMGSPSSSNELPVSTIQTGFFKADSPSLQN